MEFSLELANQLLTASATNDFPVDFDVAWQWLGYSTKGNAKQSFLNIGFVEYTDFMINHNNCGSRPEQELWLSIDCLKSWAMMSKTEQGKRVRMYFLECEKIAKAAYKPMSPAETLVHHAQMMLALERQQLEFNLTLTSHDRRLEAVEYHTSGFESHYTLKAYCSLNKIELGNRNPAVIGKHLTKLSKLIGLEVKKIADAKYGQVNAYPTEVLDHFFTGE